MESSLKFLANRPNLDLVAQLTNEEVIRLKTLFTKVQAGSGISQIAVGEQNFVFRITKKLADVQIKLFPIHPCRED